MLNPQYIKLIEEGAFPYQIDVWAEKGHYFHQLHGHMITYLLDAMRKPLLELGYRVGREASLQITERIQPDIFIHSRGAGTAKSSSYTEAAA